MSNFIFAYDLIDYTPTASSESSNYPASNIKLYDHLRRHYRSGVSTEVSIVLDFTSAKNVKVLYLNDVNFANVTIQGNSTNAWTSPPLSQSHTVLFDEQVQRRKLCVVLTTFNYRFMRVLIPAQTPTDGMSIFRIGNVLCCGSMLTLTTNPSYPYVRQASYPEPLQVSFLSGGKELVETGNYKIWTGEFGFDHLSSESDIWTLDAIRANEHIVFFENRGNSSKAYQCRKMQGYEVEEQRAGGYIKTNIVKFQEVI